MEFLKCDQGKLEENYDMFKAGVVTCDGAIIGVFGFNQVIDICHSPFT